MTRNTLAPVPDVWLVAVAARAGAVPLCAVWEGEDIGEARMAQQHQKENGHP